MRVISHPSSLIANRSVISVQSVIFLAPNMQTIFSGVIFGSLLHHDDCLLRWLNERRHFAARALAQEFGALALLPVRALIEHAAFATVPSPGPILQIARAERFARRQFFDRDHDRVLSRHSSLFRKRWHRKRDRIGPRRLWRYCVGPRRRRCPVYDSYSGREADPHRGN